MKKGNIRKNIRKIKKIIRIGLPETNSSSSHSVSINMGNDFILPGDPRFNLEIKDDTLFIPCKDDQGGGSFGWEVEKYNDPLTKLQYVCGIFCNDISTHHGRTKITKLKRLLCDILGVKNVVFEWDNKYFAELKKLGKEEAYRDYPEINHNSTDIFDEIIESQETVKHFIFNPKSWLYLGNDNSDYPSHFFDNSWIEPEDDDPEYRGWIDIGGNIGRIDFMIPYINFSDNYDTFLSVCDDIYDILTSVRYDITTKQFEIVSEKSKLSIAINEKDKDNFLNFYHSVLIEFDDGSFKIILNNKKFEDKFLEVLSNRVTTKRIPESNQGFTNSFVKISQPDVKK